MESRKCIVCNKIMVAHNLTLDDLNKLPKNVQEYIADLETNCDPAGMVSECGIVKDLNAIFENVIEVQKKKIDILQNAIDSIEKVPHHNIEVHVGEYYVGFKVEAFVLSDVNTLIKFCREEIKKLESGNKKEAEVKNNA